MIDREKSLTNNAEQGSGVSFEYTALVWCKYKKLVSQMQIAIVAPDQNLYWKQRDFATVAAYATSYANYAKNAQHRMQHRMQYRMQRKNTYEVIHTHALKNRTSIKLASVPDLPNKGRHDDMLHVLKLQKSAPLANASPLKRCRSLTGWNPQVSMTHQRFRLKVREGWDSA